VAGIAAAFVVHVAVLAVPPPTALTNLCGTMEWWQRSPEGQAYQSIMDLTGTCPTNGLCDGAPSRDAKIPTTATPWKIVPVRFQIFANDDGSNVAGTALEISNQMARLNADFAQSRVYFIYSARTNNSTLYRNCPSNSEPAMMQAFAQSPASQVNVFVTRYVGFNNCGIATFPWMTSSLTSTGGLMLQDWSLAPARFGSASTFINCFTHEMGHQLGLMHTFRGVLEVVGCNNCRELVGRSAADGDLAGDYCADTPPDPGFQSTLPPCGFPNTNDVCNGQPFSTNVVLLDNIMSYYIGCATTFTPQQRGRMHCWSENRLSSWLLNDFTAPTVAITAPTNAASFMSFGAITGWATDNYFVQSVGVLLHENDPSGGVGRWWNGTNWQGTAFTLPTILTGTNWTLDPAVVLPPMNSGISYLITASAVDGKFNAANANVTVSKPIETLVWDPGTTHEGTQVKTSPHSYGGPFIFKIVTQGTSSGIWRTALNVSSNEADIWVRFNATPTTSTYNYRAIRTGSDGFCLAQGPQFAAAQEWYYLLNTTTGSQWSLVSGEAFVQQLPILAADGSSGTNSIMGSEGMRFFKTTISSNTLAWRLGLNGLTNGLLVKKTSAPHPLNTSTFDLYQFGQMLVVPTFLNIGDQYFIGVIGEPGLNFSLDSRQQVITDLAFNSNTNFSLVANSYGYVTYRVQVPVQQIAWQLNLTLSSGDASVAARQGAVPNEFNNAGYSEVASPTADSLTLVPPTLTDGTWYITVYGVSPYSCSLTNGQPIITDVHYVFSITNDAPNRAGWRFYRVVNTAEQLGTLGWDLFLQNHAPGSEIALRRNAVPGRWTYRDLPTGNSSNSSVRGFVDYSGPNGFLQRPGHQADVWYIGVYHPTVALGPFILTGQELTGPLMTFDDGAGTTNTIVSQPAGKFQYYRIDVPTNAFGWDLRIINVTGGDPRLVVRRDQLPDNLSTHEASGCCSWSPVFSATWPSGWQVAAGGDWTGYSYDPVTVNQLGHILAMGKGNWLEAGTYYVGIINPSGSSPMSYQLVSRGIGTNFAIPLVTIPMSNGVVSVTNLFRREAAYFRIDVPSNTPSLKLKMTADVGETMLAIERGALPNVGTYVGASAQTGLDGGERVQKPGNEHYLVLPLNNQSNIAAGSYYVALVSEGVNPGVPPGNIGTGSSSSTLSTYGSLTVTNLGTVDPTGATDLTQSDAIEGAELRAYRFTVPPNTLALEIRLENRVGTPHMTLRPDAQIPRPNDDFGSDGGQFQAWQSPTLINVPNPEPGPFTLMVHASFLFPVYSNASYTVRVHAINALPVAFDGGSSSVVTQEYGTWRYFSLTVPSNAFGWDLRLINVTNGDPRLVVRRETAPDNLSTHTECCSWSPSSSTIWSSNWQIAAGVDWTGLNANNGANEVGHLLQAGMGNPIEPGRYIAGVFSGGGGGPLPMSYSILSRGIGTNFTIPIAPLAFNGGTISSNGLPAREVAYYSIIVPSNTPSWKLKVSTNSGETLLMVQRTYLPNAGASTFNDAWFVSGGVKMQRLGHEHYTMLPQNGQTNIPAGIYYLGVASEGQNPNYNQNRIGTNSSSYTLTSIGSMSVTNMGTVDNSGLTDLTQDDAMEGTELRGYQFTVPPGTLSLQVTLENRVGNPQMTLRYDTRLPAGVDSYAVDGGQGANWQNASLINIPNPAAGTYSLVVQAAFLGTAYSNASYTVRVHAQGTIPVAFDGGFASISGHAAGTWQYFLINVPTGALGWDLRLTNVTSGDPRLSIKRGALPDGLSTHTECCSWNAAAGASWPSNYQIAPGTDWTGYNATNGANEVGHLLQVGMGNPLEPGWYYVGVINGGPAVPMSYTIASRGIGTNLSIPVLSMPFVGSVTNSGLLAREGAYYSVTVPSNTPNWKVRMAPTDGEALLLVQKDFLPNIGAFYSYNAYFLQGGKKMQKSGNEHYLELPVSNVGPPFVPAGTYYIAVVSEGVNPNPGLNRIGSGMSSFSLYSQGTLPVINLGSAGGPDLSHTNTLEGAESALYSFDIPPGVPAVEVRLDNRSGNPTMALRPGARQPNTVDGFARDGGDNYSWQSPTLITLPNPTGTNYSLNVYADYQSGPNTYVNAGYSVVVHALPTPELNFDAQFNTNGLSNVASNTLATAASFFYKVIVPTNFEGAPVLGWKLDLSATFGTPSVRVRKGSLPENVFGTSPFASSQAVIVPDYLTPGTWYVEVRAAGITSYRLTSSGLRLERPAWQMPMAGQSVTTPGLPPTGPLFGDTGVDTNGVPLPLDQGIDLEQGNFHYYAVNVPSNNIGVLRTRLDAISGDPNLYIRVGKLPTRTHRFDGQGGELWERSLGANIGSEYGNWVPNNTRFEFYLTPGTWYLAVQAAGNANVRYRLRLSAGEVQNLTLGGGSLNGQTIAGGDWRYYRVIMPTNAPTNWNVSFSQQVGDAVMYFRDTAPPGQFSSTTDYRDWNDDNKNHGPYPFFDPQGNYSFRCPPLRPGATYYIGFRAVNDATFTVSSSTNGPQILHTTTIPFYGGLVTNYIPPNGVLRYRVDVPDDAYRWIHTAIHSNAISLWLDQGSVPTMTTVDHAYWLNQQNTSFNVFLRNPNVWPWQPGYMYFLTVSNTSGVSQPFSFRMDGRNAVTDDNDGDGLPDLWENTYFGNIFSQNGNGDPDGDGINNAEEYADGTDPTDRTSFKARLTLVYSHGTVTRNPVATRYVLGTVVTLSAAPDSGYVFMGWGGDTNGLMNPLDITMNTNKTILAIFGVDTSLPNADYRFQNTLASSIGTPPDLENIGAGNSFQSDIVDGFARVVYRFPLNNGLRLFPTTNTIPSNVWSMVFLVRYDNVVSYRRTVDTKMPPSEYGLYVLDGRLSFYPYVTAPAATVAASNYVQMVLTRDETNLVRGYINGVQQFAVVDASSYLVVGGTNYGLRFFIDNGGENSGGDVARIRLFNKALTPEQVPLLDRLPGVAGGGPLQFLAPVNYSNGVLRVSASLTPNFNYQIQASTNLTNWATIQNVISPVSPVLITDTNASNYLHRFYRGVTP
jgi:large repetitive protein